MQSMTLEEAKAILKENAIGSNEYETIETWQELSEAAEIETNYAEDRIRELNRLAGIANEMHEESL